MVFLDAGRVVLGVIPEVLRGEELLGGGVWAAVAAHWLSWGGGALPLGLLLLSLLLTTLMRAILLRQTLSLPFLP